MLLCCLVILQFYTNNLCAINTVTLMPVCFSEYIFYRLFLKDLVLLLLKSVGISHLLCPKHTAFSPS